MHPHRHEHIHYAQARPRHNSRELKRRGVVKQALWQFGELVLEQVPEAGGELVRCLRPSGIPALKVGVDSHQRWRRPSTGALASTHNRWSAVVWSSRPAGTLLSEFWDK